jgi:hypothetical protein
LRAVKQKLRTLGTTAPGQTAVAGRLIAMAGPGGPLPPRRRPLRTAAGNRGPRPGSRPQDRPPRYGGRRRRLVLGAVCVVVGLGTAAFAVGGGGAAAPGPRITPPVQMYSVEHAITGGGVPFTGPSGEPASHAPKP